MRAWVFSDLHLDVNRSFEPFVLPEPRPAHDVVVIAGDIGEGLAEGVRWIAETGLDRQPVIYVGGNHEVYGRDRHAELATGRAAAAARHNIHLLERDRIDIGGVAVLGCTLWTDYRLFGAQAEAMALSEKFMSDHRLIRNGARAWTAADALAEHNQSVAWLDFQLAKAPGPTLVVTHHAPSRQSISARFRTHPLTPAFGSDLDDLVARADVWVHGHTHTACDHRVGASRVINNPRGYVRREQTGFRPDLVIDVG